MFTLTIDNFALSTAGHAVVVHDAAGARIGCGLIAPTVGYVATLGTYPDYAGDYTVAGHVEVTETATGISLAGTMIGLEASGTGGFHIHSGYTCDVADGVGGHYYEGMDSDPWTTTVTAGANGVAAVNLEVAGFSLGGSMPVFGRALVAHLSTGDRAGCGVLGAPSQAGVTLAAYPDTDSTVTGTLQVVSDSGGNLKIVGTMTGLESCASGGIHIHTGVSCAVADDVGGHFFDGMDTDPWTTTYTSDSSGASSTVVTMETGFSVGSDALRVAGRTVVVHDSSGARVACGVIEPTLGSFVTLGAYPGLSLIHI